MIAVRPLTDGTIAMLNLGAQIHALDAELRLDRATVENRAALAELITLRGLIVGSIADYERAEQIAEDLVRDAPADARAWATRARARAGFHRFNEALADLDRAVQLSSDTATTRGERAAVFQAIGRYDEALFLREEAADQHPTFENVAALAGLHAEHGEIEAAERHFAKCRRLYRGVSPFPLALLDFQRGRMWMDEDRLREARDAFDAAQGALPAYAAARGHLAEVEAQMGGIEAAVARLRPLADSSDDPDYAAQLAHILRDAGCDAESWCWRQLAATRYDDLVARRPEAFADHAAEFWLAAGANPDKAWRLAKINAAVRDTPRARRLLAQAAVAKAL